MDFEKEYTNLHFNEDRLEAPIFYIGFRVKKALSLIVTDREVRQFGAVKRIEDIKSLWELETFTEASDFYKRIQKFLPMVVTL